MIYSICFDSCFFSLSIVRRIFASTNASKVGAQITQESVDLRHDASLLALCRAQKRIRSLERTSRAVAAYLHLCHDILLALTLVFFIKVCFSLWFCVLFFGVVDVNLIPTYKTVYAIPALTCNRAAPNHASNAESVRTINCGPWTVLHASCPLSN